MLQSSTAAMLRCRSGRSRRPAPAPVSSNLLSRVEGDSSRMPGAASSRARGMPSSRRQIAASAGASRSVTSRGEPAAAARSRRRATAGDAATVSTSSWLGVASGDRTSSRSARTRKGARLVARTTRSGQRATRSASTGAAPVSCSRLSSTTITRRPWRCETSARTGSATSSGRPSAAVTRGRTSPGSRTAARSTNTAPPGKADASRRRTSVARRVLPTPPGPVMVTRRCAPDCTRARSSSISASRPMSGVDGISTVAGVARATGSRQSRHAGCRVCREEAAPTWRGSVVDAGCGGSRGRRGVLRCSVFRCEGA